MLHLLNDVIQFGFTSSKGKGVSRKSFLKKENVQTALLGKQQESTGSKHSLLLVNLMLTLNIS